MSLSASEIGLVSAALNEEISGGLLRKVLSARTPDHLVLELWTTRGKEMLQFVLMPGFVRFGRIEKKPKTADFPHPFVMLLRRFAAGMALVQVRQLGGDRVVSFDFKGRDRAGSLICELTSRHSNLFWLDGNGTIAGSFHPNRSHKRILVPGADYEVPIPRLSEDNRQGVVRFSKGTSLETEIEAFYLQLQNEKLRDARRAAVTRAVKVAQRRLSKLHRNLLADKKRADEAEALQTDAHLLQANLHQAKKGMTQLKVTDFEGRLATISLDPTRDPVANMNKMFERAKRLRRATPKIGGRLKETSDWLSRVNFLLDRIQGSDEQGLSEIVSEVSRRFSDLASKSTPGKKSQQVRLPFREFAIAAGRVARVGRSAEDNDALTLKHTKPGDLWMHVRGRKGSHVVVPMGRGESPSAEILIDAAHLAAHYSDARGDADVEVTHTLRRYVQKPKGAAKGSVRLIKEKTVMLRVDEERLARLLKSSYQSPEPLSE